MEKRTTKVRDDKELSIMKLRLDLRLQAYRFLREEILHSIELQYKIIMAMATVVAFILGLSIVQPTWTLVILVLPWIATAFVSLWLIEFTRMMRAGGFLHLLEKDINAEVGELCIYWETMLRECRELEVGVHKIHRHVMQMFLVILAFTVIAASVPFVLLIYQEGAIAIEGVAWVSICTLLILPILVLIYLLKQAFNVVRHTELISMDAFERWKREQYNRLKVDEKGYAITD